MYRLDLTEPKQVSFIMLHYASLIDVSHIFGVDLHILYSAWAWSIPSVKSAGTEKETRLYLA